MPRAAASWWTPRNSRRTARSTCAPHDDPGHLDFVAMSAHKLYAPFGSGALVGPRDAFAARPDHSGGGTINLVTLDDVVWADLPDREEAGTPNVLGAIAFAAATSILEEIGFARIAAHEADLTRHALARLARVPGVTVYGPTGPSAADPSRRLGVVSFAVEGLDHAYVAAVLGYEHGIGVRSGCFCAQPYIAHLLRLDRGRTGTVARSGAPQRPSRPLPASSASASVVTTTTRMSIARSTRSSKPWSAAAARTTRHATVRSFPPATTNPRCSTSPTLGASPRGPQ